MKKAAETIVPLLVMHQVPKAVAEPADRLLDFVSSLETNQFAPILQDITLAVRADKVDLSGFQPLKQRTATRRLLAEHSPGGSIVDPVVEQHLDQVDLGFGRAADVNADRRSIAIDENHQIRVLGAIGQVNVGDPLLPEKTWRRRSLLSRFVRRRVSSLSGSRIHTLKCTPMVAHMLSRRQQVLHDE